MTVAWRGSIVAAALLAAALVERLLLRHAPARVALDLAQPLAVATNWGQFGAALLGITLAALAAGGLAYRGVLSRTAPSLAALIGIVAFALVAAWWAPVLFSSDVYAYAAYGELARLGANPYAHATIDRANPLLAAASWQWGGAIPTCVYGPAFVGLARAAVGTLAPLGTIAQLDGLRLLASGALLLCAPLAFAAFPGDRSAKLRAAATIALNPTAIWCAAEGHNDAIALSIVLAGFAVARRGLWGIGAATVAISALVKSPAALAAVALGVTHRRARVGASLGIALCAALSLPLLLGIAMRLAPNARYGPNASLQAVVAPLGEPAALVIAAAVCGLIALDGFVRLRRGAEDGWLRLAIAGWVLVPNPYPWYGVWLVALAATAPRSRAATVAVLLSFTSLLRYVPDAVGTPSPAFSIAIGLAATVPVMWLFAPSRT